jgi:hypothetical protein
MSKLGPRISKNRILTRLSENDSNLLFPHLDPIDLPLRMSIELSDRPIDHVYFVEQGFASALMLGVRRSDVTHTLNLGEAGSYSNKSWHHYHHRPRGT